jgi:GNAT superfamily N-acetyltransferase
LKIVNLTKENVSLALCCESYGGHWEEGVEERRKFLLWKLKHGKVRGKIALEEERLGWIDYYPREDGWFRIACILVDKKHRGRGVGCALVNACLKDCRGGKGALVGATVWEHMPKGFFKKCGFVDPDPEANISVMAMRFVEEKAPPPEEKRKFTPKLEAGKLVIDMLDNGQCPTSYVTRQLVREAAMDFTDKIVIREHDMKNEVEIKRFGDLKGIFLDGKGAFFGHPGEVEKIKEILRKRLEAKTK